MNFAWPDWLEFHLMARNHVWPQVVRLKSTETKNKQSSEFFSSSPLDRVHFTIKHTAREENAWMKKKKYTVECYCRRTIKMHWFMFSHPMCAVLRCTHSDTRVHRLHAVPSVKVICILNLIIRLLLLFQFKLHYVGIRNAWSWPPTHWLKLMLLLFVARSGCSAVIQ